ncbi:binder of sperm protein homolog 2-like [Oculina patagonica]
MKFVAILLLSALACSVVNEDGNCCAFPFVYNGQTYYQCTSDDWDRPWCSLTANYDQDGQWGNCGVCTTVQTEEGGCCHFPFLYNCQTYNQCTSDDWIQPWCSLTVDYNQDTQWGNCVENPSTTPSSPPPPPTTSDNPSTTATLPPTTSGKPIKQID